MRFTNSCMPNCGQCVLCNWLSVQLTLPSSLLSVDHCNLICSKHPLITSIGELPMLYRFSPDQSIPAFSLHSKLFPSLYRCLWCRLWRGNSLLETTGSSANDLYPGWGYCFHVLRNSCIFLFRYRLYIVFFFSTMDHLFPQRDTGGTGVVVIEETFKKINTWTLV